MREWIYNNKIMLTFGAAFFISVFMVSGKQAVRADESISYDKSFMSIEIQQGDTLHSIAEEYAVSGVNCDTYISEVKNINNLHSDTIHAGCYLLIPIYQEKVTE